ncbi:MAG TPA: aminoglycoside phosphotransferase family protein [Phenylobacterium sp.]|nr:aminoglycoside phosphotransferase family protein [Phenylobacterium sp.]
MTGDALLQPWITRWALVPDGAAFSTEYTASRLQPVRTRDGTRAMLKLATSAEERRGAAALTLFGEAAAPVLAQDGDALLLLRLDGERDLVAMAADGRDDEATVILCDVLSRLHRPAPTSSVLVDLPDWFAALRAAAAMADRDPLYAIAWRTAQTLLAEDAPRMALHGDMHHGNVLRAADGRWLAIDPKGLAGDAGFDFANILHNPSAEVAHAPGRLGRQARVIAARSGQPLARVLRWTLSYACLSAAWSRADGREDWEALGLTTARIAQAELAAIV